MRSIGQAADESVVEMSYLELQSIGDANHHHGLRRYANGHYFTELTDPAIEAFLTRGVAAADGADWSRVAPGGLQAYGGAIAEVANEDSAFSHRDALVEFFGGHTWADPAEDDDRMESARAFGDVLEPFASGVYVNALVDDDEAGRSPRLRRREAPAAVGAEGPVGSRQRLPPEPEHPASPVSRR